MPTAKASAFSAGLERLSKINCVIMTCAIAKSTFYYCMARKLTLPNGENCSLAELETAVGCAPSRQSHVRLQAIRSLWLAGALGIEAQRALVKPPTDASSETWIYLAMINLMVHRLKPG